MVLLKEDSILLVLFVLFNLFFPLFYDIFSQLFDVLESVCWPLLQACVLLHCGSKFILKDFFWVDKSFSVVVACTRIATLNAWVLHTPLILEMQARVITKVVASLYEALVISGWSISKGDDTGVFSVIQTMAFHHIALEFSCFFHQKFAAFFA